MAIPHKCPVCEGKGQVPAGFYATGFPYTTGANDEMCKACWGSGIAWESLKIENDEDFGIPRYPAFVRSMTELIEGVDSGAIDVSRWKRL